MRARTPAPRTIRIGSGYTKLMDAKESNAGFIALHTPLGMLILVFAFCLFVAVIGAGAAFFKAAQAKDRETREKLRADVQSHANDKPAA